MSLTDTTVRVKRGGSFLTIPKDAVSRYLSKGFDIVDSNGEIITPSVPNDVVTLQAAFNKHVAEIAQLKAEIEALKAEKEPAEEKKPAARKTTKKAE